jgi:Flp pilus assembly protein TadG
MRLWQKFLSLLRAREGVAQFVFRSDGVASRARKRVAQFVFRSDGVASRARKRVAQFVFRSDGVAAMEFALNLPILLLLSFGGFEVSRFLLIQQKTDKIAYIVADVISQSTSSNLSNTQINQILIAAAKVMEPMTFGADGYVIVNSVTKTGTNAPKVSWQRTGGGTMTKASQVGVANGTATMPGGITLADKDNVIVVEVFYRYTPLFGAGYLASQQFYRAAMYKPRLGSLTTAPT